MLVANRVKEGGEGEKKKSLNEVLRVLVMRHDYTRETETCLCAACRERAPWCSPFRGCQLETIGEKQLDETV